jgi:hypothetical protein
MLVLDASHASPGPATQACIVSAFIHTGWGKSQSRYNSYTSREEDIRAVWFCAVVSQGGVEAASNPVVPLILVWDLRPVKAKFLSQIDICSRDAEVVEKLAALGS